MKAVKLTESTNLFPVVGIGASAGGLAAFQRLIRGIPENSGMAYVLVQHLDPSHESILPELLQKVALIPVREISDELKVEPNHIYVLPSNKMLMANDGVLELTPRSQSHGSRNLPIDVFFTSLAEVHRSHAIGVVLSGTASDGTEGLKAIRQYGGMTFAQDAASAAYDSMPMSAVAAGVVDFVLLPEEIPLKILEVKKNNGGNRQIAEANEAFGRIISLLRTRKGTDFTHYKQATIRRRILRRMVLHKFEDSGIYFDYLAENPAEQDLLYQDLLIPVTSFFRDPESFDYLCESVFPVMVKRKREDEAVRIWVAACSTGQEAYSMAICLKEFLGDIERKIQIFATDISEPAIEKARTGIYTKRELKNLSSERLETYFTPVSGGYRVNQDVRDMCIFAVHNFLKDPPFGKMDLISCRNVLIYMETYLQEKALTTFHYALNPKAFLFLGKTETAGTASDLFALVGKQHKLFMRKEGSGKFIHMASQRSEQYVGRSNVHPKIEASRSDYRKKADEIVLSKYAPAGVIVNEMLDIVHFRGSTGSFLEQLPGKPSHNLLKMAKHELAFTLRNILHKAKKENSEVLQETVLFQVEGIVSRILIAVYALPDTIESYHLILFRNLGAVETTGNNKLPENAGARENEMEIRILQLEQELGRTHEDMRSIIEEQETVNEELQRDNEEMLSSSEELQSLNEELETSKEELQSTNEELMVVNQSMNGLNELLSDARDYAQAIVDTVREPLLVLDQHLRIRTANTSYYKVFNTTAAETEGKLIYEIDRRRWGISALRKLLEDVLTEKSSFGNFESGYTTAEGSDRILLLNARGLVLNANAEKLILLGFDDITEQRRAQGIEQKIQEHNRFIADAMPQKVWTADAEGNWNYFNKTWLVNSGLSFEELKDSGWEKVIHPDDSEANRRQWRNSILTGEVFEREDRFMNKDGVYQWHLSRGLPFKDELGKVIMWVGTNTEIQGQREEKEVLEKAVVERTSDLLEATNVLGDKNSELVKMNEELQAFAYVSSHDLQEPLRKIQTFANRILDKEHDTLSENGKFYFSRMEAAASRMQQLIEDLLTYSRVNATERKFELIDLCEIVDEVEIDLHEAIAEKQAVITCIELGPVRIVRFQFRQLMHNLLSNALKFSAPGSIPEIIINCSTKKGAEFNLANAGLVGNSLSPSKDYCHIRVSDNGIGFEQQFGRRIFDVFQKLHPKEEYAGTGIGLAIVKKIVENHNGFITASSELDKGAVFDVYIPASTVVN